MLDKLKIALQYILPKHLVSRLMGKFAASEAGIFTKLFIRWFIKQYRINMAEAKYPASHYRTFNEFFTRPLKENARPLFDQSKTFVHPVDGCISQLGDINEGSLIQAKGHEFNATTLLGGDSERAAPFNSGKFATIYLAPKDYHRIHMPLDGTLKQMIYVPGDLFSVNPLTAQNVPNLFARNERVVAIFDTAIGPMAMVLVGATIVASIETVWAGTVTPPTGKSVNVWNYSTDHQPIHLKKGEEMGRFKLGSTVVLLFQHDVIEFLADIQPESVTRMGEHFGNLTS